MALADIIQRIDTDANAEAAGVVAVAEERAQATLETARATADAATAQTLAAAEHAAKRDADTIVVNARLQARDALVAAKRDLIENALAKGAEAAAALDDDAYAQFLARHIARAAQGGETVLFGSEDMARGVSIMEHVKTLAPELKLVVAEDAAPFGRGALLKGARMRVDLSLPAIVEDRRDELELVVAAVLFGKEA